MIEKYKKYNCKLCGQDNVEDLIKYVSQRYCQHPYEYEFKTLLKICNN